MTLQRRTAHLVRESVADPADGEPYQFTARVVNYGVVDKHRTTFAPGVFTDSLAKRMPLLFFGHSGDFDLSHVLGRAVEYAERKDGLDMTFRLDDFDAVPAARQAWAQLKSGTLDEFSVGFWIGEQGEPDDETLVSEIRKGDLVEVSIVPEGSVPGTALLAMSRNATDRVIAGLVKRAAAAAVAGEAPGVVPPSVLAAVLEQVAAGDVTVESALAILGTQAPPAEGQEGQGDGGEGDGPPAGDEGENGDQGGNGDPADHTAADDEVVAAMMAEVDAIMADDDL